MASSSEKQKRDLGKTSWPEHNQAAAQTPRQTDALILEAEERPRSASGRLGGSLESGNMELLHGQRKAWRRVSTMEMEGIGAEGLAPDVDNKYVEGDGCPPR